MTRYAFHDLLLEVEGTGTEGAVELDRILGELFWERVGAASGATGLSLSIREGEDGFDLPRDAREVLRAVGFRGLEVGSTFYLTDGESSFRLEPGERLGEARLAPSFFQKPFLLRQNFWVFGLLKLLRVSGNYGLHAACLVAENGSGVLLVGRSGSGKSTLSIAMVRLGWRYLSDDAVLLRSGGAIEALALRRHFYVLGEEAGDYADVPLGEERPDRDGGLRRLVDVETAYPGQRVAACTPRVLLFPRLSREPRSVLTAMEPSEALGRLIGQSSPQLFDRWTMPLHLATLSALLRQAAAYELSAGLDLLENAGALERLLTAAENEETCLASSSS